MRFLLAALALVLIAPVIAVTLLSLVRLSAAEHAANDNNNLNTARAFLGEVDHQFQEAEAALNALATVPDPMQDLSSFYQQAWAVAEQHAARIVLFDATLRPVFNTEKPLGTEFEIINNVPIEAMQTRRPHISNLFTGVITGERLVAVDVPVLADGWVKYVLRMAFRPEVISRFFARQQVPAEWTVAIVDRDGLLVGRNRMLDQVLGKPATPDLQAALNSKSEGNAVLFTKDGMEVYTAFTRSSYSGWSVALGIPRAIVDAPLRSSLREIGAEGLLMLVLCGLVEFITERRISRGMNALSKAALSLGQGLEPPPVQSKIREMHDVGVALRMASDSLRRRAEERDRAEAALIESREHLARAQRISGVGSIVRDFRSGRREYSDEFRRIFGIDDAAFQPTIRDVLKFVHPDDLATAEAVVQASLQTRGAAGPIEMRIIRPCGDVRTVYSEMDVILDETGKPAQRIITFKDVTELRGTQDRERLLYQQLMHAQRVEALGTLAGGIAHDLNNTLVPILAITKLALSELPEKSLIRDDLQTIARASERARDLVRQILAFSRKQESNPQRIDLAAITREALSMMRAGVMTTIEIADEVEQVPPVLFDPGGFHQVITNLITNAAQAIGSASGTINVALVVVGNEARLTVSDTGCGMDAETLERVFEPFFTTKVVGEGTGLGLSVVQGIVTGHGGRLEVTSTVGVGTTFTVWIPLASVDDVERPHPVLAA